MNDNHTTKYFPEFINYFNKAYKLEQHTFNIRKTTEQEINDDLMWNVPIYNVVHRRYAGFSNLLECLWYNTDMPKYKVKPSSIHKNYIPKSKLNYSEEIWFYLFLVHRITGSGASFMKDHGYRNTVLPELIEYNNTQDMANHIKNKQEPMFTSLGNQIPPFPKPSLGYDKGGKLYLCHYAPKLAKDLQSFLQNNNQQISIKKGVDFVLDWHVSNNLKRFKFVLTAWIMDIAEYFPQYIDPKSPVHLGKNALETIDLIFKDKPRNIKKEDFQDLCLDYICNKINYISMPYDIEDVLCDFIRYVESFIPSKDYEHLELDGPKAIMNNMSFSHNKGRIWKDWNLKNKVIIL